jgi:hypothetical protein
MSYLRFEGIALKNLCIARPNRGTCKGIGAENALARRRAHTRPLVAATSPPCVAIVRLKVCAWPRYASASRASLGAASAGVAACHATCTRARDAVLAPAAPARRGSASYCALKRRGALAAKRPHPRALGYKKPPPSPSRVSPPSAAAIAAAAGEHLPPLAPAAGQGFQPLP